MCQRKLLSKSKIFWSNLNAGSFYEYMYNYNTPMLHFGPYVTFQPRVRHILAHCMSLFGPMYVTFWPCGHAHKCTPPPPPMSWTQSNFGWKYIKEKTKIKMNTWKMERHMKFNDFFLLNPSVVWTIVKYCYGEYTVTLMRLLSNMAGSRQFSV